MRSFCQFITALLFLFCPDSHVMAGSPAATTSRPQYTEEDILGSPQNVLHFVTAAEADSPLIPYTKQLEWDRKSNGIFFGPWGLRKARFTREQFQKSLLHKARGYDLDMEWTQAVWNEMLDNAHVSQYPQTLGSAIITAHTNLRSMPTTKVLYYAPSPKKVFDIFDFFQLSSLPLGTPIFVSHVSKDKKWYYIECPLAVGWVESSAVALTRPDFKKAYRKGKYAVVLTDYTDIPLSHGPSSLQAHIGSSFPAGDEGEIFVPVRDDQGYASMVRTRLRPEDVAEKPLPLTKKNMGTLAQKMLGQPYAWGGSNAQRDCSLAMRDFFLPFGLWLPRNSKHQAQSGNYTKVNHLSPASKKAYILKHAKPFQTFFGLPGHIGLYVGEYKGEPVMLHNIMGLRTASEEDTYRFLIGKCILSNLEPGANIPEIDLFETLLERVNALRAVF